MSDQPDHLHDAARLLIEEAAALTDALRASKLRTFRVLDTPAEQVFDDLVDIAATMCGAPAAVLTFIDSDRAYVKSSHSGPPLGNEKLSDSFCRTTIQTPGSVMVIEDAHLDPRFKDNWKVTTGLLSAYCGAPIITEGTAVGAICVVDPMPRSFSMEEKSYLERIARVIAEILIGRRD